MNYYNNMGYGYSPFEFVFHALIWILVIAIIIKLFRKSKWHGMNHENWLGGKSALDILNERYAKGEINKLEYEEKKADLKNE